jgi:hypothetical protein
MGSPKLEIASEEMALDIKHHLNWVRRTSGEREMLMEVSNLLRSLSDHLDERAIFLAQHQLPEVPCLTPFVDTAEGALTT